MPAADVAAFVADHLTTEHMAAYLADDARYLLHVADAEGELVGYTLTVLPRAADEPPAAADVAAAVTARPAAELSKCYLLPPYQGTGLAAALVETAAAAAAATTVAGEPVAVLWLGTNRANRRAQRSYARQGFTVVGTRRFRVGGSLEEDVVMARPLTTGQE
ncbi:GNAT family N-acetyltransferase [Georgenia sp. TF02-10]|uniref:GNAT family N-acetyltransferase n=1 Tax=Georgenia sp. TF02-10 TaxID=2917725 RepID=UPI00352C2209